MAETRKSQIDADKAKLDELRGQIQSGYSGGTKVASQFKNYVKDYQRNTGKKVNILDPKERARLEAMQQQDLDIYRQTKQIGSNISQNEQMVMQDTNLSQDMEVSKTQANEFMSDKRLADQAATTSSRALLEQNMSSSAESMARREQAVRGLQGAEATQNRQLMAQLGSSGLRGGAALGATQDLSIAQQNNRRAMEQDLYLTDQNLDRQARTQLAGFDMDIAKTDLATQTSSELGFLNMAQSNRSAILQREAMMEAARIQADASGGKK